MKISWSIYTLETGCKRLIQLWLEWPVFSLDFRELLNPYQLQSAMTVLPEGHSAAASTLAKVHPRIPERLATNAVDKALRPYYDELLRRTAPDSLFAGYKLIRPENRSLQGAHQEDADLGSDDESGDATAIADENAPEVLYWFFFPLATKSGGAGNVVAWEASSRSGRATYFFRLVEPGEEALLNDSAKASVAVERGIGRITRVLGMVNFRRRPIYLSEDDLTRDVRVPPLRDRCPQNSRPAPGPRSFSRAGNTQFV